MLPALGVTIFWGEFNVEAVGGRRNGCPGHGLDQASYCREKK